MCSVDRLYIDEEVWDGEQGWLNQCEMYSKQVALSIWRGAYYPATLTQQVLHEPILFSIRSIPIFYTSYDSFSRLND